MIETEIKLLVNEIRLLNVKISDLIRDLEECRQRERERDR